VSGRVTSLRKTGKSFVATCSGSEVNARVILLATGLVDHCPPIEGQPADCPSEVIRFCPICDGYEAIDRWVGVLGDIKAGGKKALFLRTYHVSLFLTDETTEDVNWHEKLTKANVTIVGKLKQIRQATENTVTIVTHGGRAMKWTLSTLLSVATFAPILPLGLEPHRPRTATSKLMTISGQP
jgi:thioredoxin reductase (NADPH)